MRRAPSLLRLTPEAAGELQQQHAKATTELRNATRYRKAFERALAAKIGSEAVRQLHKDTQNALLLADLLKEAA